MNKPDARARHEAAVARAAASLLEDTRYDRWRPTGRRRLLVLAATLSIILTCYTAWIGDVFLLLPAIMVSGGCWWILRKVVRGMADLPDEFVDERIRAVRNEHYLYAYRLLSGGACLVVLLMFMAADARQLAWQVEARHLEALFWAVLLSSLMLPSMLLAWSQREV